MATLYANADRTRFFHVPDDAKLPPGDLVVRSLTGAKIEADPVALDVYEVSEAEAMRIGRAVLAGFGDSIRAFTVAASKALSQPARLDPEAVKAREERVAAHLNLARDQLRQDPKALGGALKVALQGLVTAAQETAQAPETARARVGDIAEALRQEGAPPEATAALEALPDKLREILESQDTLAKLDAAAKDLREAAAALRAENEQRRAKDERAKDEPAN